MDKELGSKEEDNQDAVKAIVVGESRIIEQHIVHLSQIISGVGLHTESGKIREIANQFKYIGDTVLSG